MFVIADIEWITHEDGLKAPTQLAAAKVDSSWNEKETFFSFIQPKDNMYLDWTHVAYTGGTSIDYLLAPKVSNIFKKFLSWLKPNDIILWWYKESEKVYQNIIETVLKQKENHKMVSIKEYVRTYLECEPFTGGSSYAVAEQQGVDLRNELRHYSVNDVRVMRELLSKIKYPQKRLLDPFANTKAEWKRDNLPFQYDPVTNKLHRRDCQSITGVKTIGFATLLTPIKRGYSSCVCCREEYRNALFERNQSIIEKSQYTYIYTPESNKFHKYNCHLMHHAKSIMGTQTYDAVAKTGKVSCKICNPSPLDVRNSVSAKAKETRLVNKIEKSLSREQLKAVKRQKAAVKERELALQRTDISDVEKDDIYTLTQPRFAFWASKGYQNFHLHSCSKLQSINHLIGFSTYSEAIHAGYSPCKKCKPTAKHDIHISIPITSKIRFDEKLSDLEKLCADANYEYKAQSKYLYITTPAGKWRINISSTPITVDHINLIITPHESKYHEQPRLFLSFIDVFNYIKRHDDELLRKAK